MKKNFFIIICLLFIIITPVYAETVNQCDQSEGYGEGEGSGLGKATSKADGLSGACLNSKGACTKGWGIVITLWYSDGVRDPYRIGRDQVLIYHSSLTADVTRNVLNKECGKFRVPTNPDKGEPLDVPLICEDTLVYKWKDVKFTGAGWTNGKPKTMILDNNLPQPGAVAGEIVEYVEDKTNGIFSKTSRLGVASSIENLNDYFSPPYTITKQNMKYFYVSVEPVIRDVPKYDTNLYNEPNTGSPKYSPYDGYAETKTKDWGEPYCADGYSENARGTCSKCTGGRDAAGTCLGYSTQPKEQPTVTYTTQMTYYRKFEVKTRISPIRNMCISTTYLISMYDDYGTTRNRHCLRDKDTGLCIPNQYEWYIGPVISTAITAYGGNPFRWKLVTNDTTYLRNNYKCTNPSVWNGTKGNPDTMGIVFYSALRCSVACTYADGSKMVGDDLLKCAEDYCDNYIPYDPKNPKEKMGCIIDSCGYEPPEESCDTPGFNPNDPLKNPDKATNPLNANSMCSIDQRPGVPNNGQDIVNVPGVLNTCTTYDKPNFKTPIDMRKYHSVSCVERTRAKFLDTSFNILVAGEGLNYYTNVYGDKTCNVIFHTESWKFDYATIHSADTGKDELGRGRRQRMLDLLNNYNNAANLDGIKDLDGNIITRWTDLQYDTNAPVVKTVVTEIVEQKEVKSKTYILPKTYEKISKSIKVVETKTTKIMINNTATNRNVNNYAQDSNAEMEYTIPAHCLTRDGLSQSYEATDGKCLAGDAEPRTVYYTNINATRTVDITGNRNHHVNTTVSINQASGNSRHAEVDIAEYCTYQIIGNGCEGPDCDLGCVIGVISDNSDETGNNVYIGDTELELNIIDGQLPDTDFITGWDIKESTVELKPEIKEYTTWVKINDSNMCPPPYITRTVTIKGRVTTKEGRIATCEKTITLVNIKKTTETDNSDGGKSNSTQGTVACEVIRTENTALGSKFELKVTMGTATRVQMWRSGERPTTIVPDAITNKYTLKTDPLTNRYSVYGSVKGSDGCEAICYYRHCSGDNCAEPKQCIKQVNPTQYDKVRDFCTANWNIDIAGYESVHDCVNNCARGWNCRNIDSCDPAIIKTQCELNYLDWGYKNDEKMTAATAIASCVNDCNRWRGCTGRGMTYIYRPILLTNPFPKSYVDLKSASTDRIIGGNWIGKDKYISEDYDDPTSVTGGASSNSLPEYEIILTPDRIKEIRNANAYYNSTGKKGDPKNIYLDWVYFKNEKNGTYISNFVHSDETIDDSRGFSSYFTYINGVKIR